MLGYRQLSTLLRLTRARFPTFSPYSTPTQFAPLGSGDDFAAFDMSTFREILMALFLHIPPYLNPGFLMNKNL